MSLDSSIKQALNGSKSHETFSITDSQTGKNIAVRDLTDDELKRYFTDIGAQYELARKQAAAALYQSEQMARALAIMEYETDRRSRLLVTRLS